MFDLTPAPDSPMHAYRWHPSGVDECPVRAGLGHCPHYADFGLDCCYCKGVPAPKGPPPPTCFVCRRRLRGKTWRIHLPAPLRITSALLFGSLNWRGLQPIVIELCDQTEVTVALTRLNFLKHLHERGWINESDG